MSCLILNCPQQIIAKQFCKKHYQMFQQSEYFEIGKICKVTDCQSPIRCKGLCTKHYTRQRQYGNVNRDLFSIENQIKRFWLKVEKSTNFLECWEWRAARDVGGYGRVMWQGKTRPSHVIAFILSGGSLKQGEVVRHKICANRICCNPLHLFSGSHANNQQDSIVDGTWAKGEKHGGSKLSETQVLEIIRRYRNGEKQVPLAKEYGVNQSQISYIVNKKHWAHLHNER